MKMYYVEIINYSCCMYAVTCDLPTQLLDDPVVVVNGSKEIPYREGQFITYMCTPGFILTGPSQVNTKTDLEPARVEL